MAKKTGKIETVPLESLKIDPANARSHDRRNLDAIKASLGAFGVQGVLAVVDADGIVRAGNGRVAAARELGWTEAQVFRSPLRGAEAMAFAIADNRTAELAEWDDDALAKTLAALQNDDSIDHLLTGFDDGEIERLISGLTPAEIIEDEAPAPPADPITKPGDLILLGEHRLLCGDSTKAEDVARVLGDRKPFIMVTDPPYGVEYEGGEVNEKKREKLAGDASASLYIPAYAMCPCDVTYAWFADSKALPVYAAACDSGYEPRVLLIWNKLKAHYAAPSAHYKQRHEPCLYAVKKGRSAKWAGDMTVATVWDIEQPHKNEHHPTQKPVECMARPIRNHGGKDDDVYDPFLGSGTTLIAAEQLGRKCYGIEISPAYCDVIVQRWEKLTGKKAVRNG